jgi:hypothetical protein
MKACSLLVFCEQTTFSPLLNSRAQLLRASIIMPSQPAKSCATQEKSSLAEREKKREKGLGDLPIVEQKRSSREKSWKQRCFLPLSNPCHI